MVTLSTADSRETDLLKAVNPVLAVVEFYDNLGIKDKMIGIGHEINGFQVLCAIGTKTAMIFCEICPQYNILKRSK